MCWISLDPGDKKKTGQHIGPRRSASVPVTTKYSVHVQPPQGSKIQRKSTTRVGEKDIKVQRSESHHTSRHNSSHKSSASPIGTSVDRIKVRGSVKVLNTRDRSIRRKEKAVDLPGVATTSSTGHSYQNFIHTKSLNLYYKAQRSHSRSRSNRESARKPYADHTWAQGKPKVMSIRDSAASDTHMLPAVPMHPAQLSWAPNDVNFSANIVDAEALSNPDYSASYGSRIFVAEPYGRYPSSDDAHIIHASPSSAPPPVIVQASPPRAAQAAIIHHASPPPLPEIVHATPTPAYVTVNRPRRRQETYGGVPLVYTELPKSLGLPKAPDPPTGLTYEISPPVSSHDSASLRFENMAAGPHLHASVSSSSGFNAHAREHMSSGSFGAGPGGSYSYLPPPVPSGPLPPQLQYSQGQSIHGSNEYVLRPPPPPPSVVRTGPNPSHLFDRIRYGGGHQRPLRPSTPSPQQSPPPSPELPPPAPHVPTHHHHDRTRRHEAKPRHGHRRNESKTSSSSSSSNTSSSSDSSSSSSTSSSDSTGTSTRVSVSSNGNTEWKWRQGRARAAVPGGTTSASTTRTSKMRMMGSRGLWAEIPRYARAGGVDTDGESGVGMTPLAADGPMAGGQRKDQGQEQGHGSRSGRDRASGRAHIWGGGTAGWRR